MEEEIAHAMEDLQLAAPQLICLRLKVSDALYLGIFIFAMRRRIKKNSTMPFFCLGLERTYDKIFSYVKMAIDY